MLNSPTLKLDVTNSNSIQDITEESSRFSAVLDRSFSDIETLLKSSSKVRKCTTKSSNSQIEAQFCFGFGMLLVELKPHTEDNFQKPNSAKKTKIILRKDHVHTSEENEKAFDILLEYLENKN